MKTHHNIFLIVFLIVFSFNCTAHQNAVAIYESENLKTYVSWVDRKAIFQKAELFTLLSQELIDRNEFEYQIIVNFTGSRTEETKYSIRIGHKQENSYNRIVFPVIKDDKSAIVITILSSNFSIESSLKILEYAISNYSQLKKAQKGLKPYSVLNEAALNSKLVEEIISNENSELMESVLSSPVYVRISFMKFFLRDGKFCFQSSQGTGNDYPILLELHDVFQIKGMGNRTFVFDTDSTFYCLSDSRNPRLAKRHYIKGTKWSYEAFNIKHIGSRFYSIYFSYRYPEIVYHQMLRESGFNPDDQESLLQGFVNIAWFYTKSMIYDFETDSIIVEDLNELVPTESETH